MSISAASCFDDHLGELSQTGTDAAQAASALQLT